MHDDEYRAMFDLEEHLWWFVGMRAITASILDRAVKQIERPRLLDVGCGTGYSLLWLKKLLRCEAAFGVDRSERAAALWQLRELDTASIASADSLPFPSRSFDLVTCFDCIYQFEPERARASVAEMRRVLKPGGLLFIREPAYQWMRGSHDVAVGTRHRYTRKELLGLLCSQGFAIRRATYANTLLFLAAVPHRFWSRLRGREDSDVKPVPGLVNSAFEAALKIEARLVRHIALPFGLSIVALAQKKSDY